MIIFNAKPGNGCKVSITGPIFDWDSTDFESAVAQADGGPIEVWVNSNGGDLQAGFAIRNILAMYPGEVVVHAIGPVHSAASVAVCVKNAKIIAHNGSAFMIHRCSAYTDGNCEELRKTADVLEKLDDSLVAVYSERLKADEKQIRKMLSAETWLNPDEAVDLGLADERYESDPVVPLMDMRPAQDGGAQLPTIEELIARAVAECSARISDDLGARINASSKLVEISSGDVKAACDRVGASAESYESKLSDVSARLDDLSKKCDALASKNSELSAALSRAYALDESGSISTAQAAPSFKLKF